MLAASLAFGIGTAKSQTAYFTNTLGGTWNTPANWDLDFTGVNVVPAEGTNVDIGSFGAMTVDYNAPMAATSFGALSVIGGATLNVNVAGFNQDLGGAGTAIFSLSSATMNVNAGGVWTATNGGTSTIGLGGSLNVSGTAYLAPVSGTLPLLINAAANLNVNSGGKMTIADGGATSVSGTIVVGGDLTISNSGSLNLLTGSSTTVNGGALVLTNNTGTVALGEGTSSDANAGATFTNNAGSVIFGPQLVIRSRDTKFALNGGTLDLVGGLNYNVSGNDGRQWVLINGGTANLNNVTINRAVLNTGGLFVKDGVVNSASIRIGVGIAAANSRMDGGVWTNAGAFYIGDRNNPATGSRRVYFVMNGGELVTLGSDGIVINNQGQTTLSSPTDDGGTLDINGGTITTEGIYLNGPSVTANAYARFELSAGTVYLGTLGLIANTVGSDMTAVFTLTGGTLAAKDSWTSTANLPLGGVLTFQAADANGVGHDITLNGILSSSGGFNKTGAGTLILGAANTYSGVTTVNAGTLALGAAGNVANSIQIAVNSGAVFDVTGSGGFTLGAAKTLSGAGTVQGDLAVASGGTINPGSNTVTGTLTISGALTQTGGAVNHFELPNAPGPTNDRLIVGGDLNISGVNTLEVVGGGAPGSVHALIQYGGNFNGTLANFSLVGASGVLTNDTSNKTIGFIVTSSVRSPASVVWVGNASFNDWDVINRTNWSNGGVLDYFVTGDNVLFDATGIANPNVNLVGNVAPASTTVGAAGNYTFGGAGSITGIGALIKTNTGTLTINTVNAYTGPTLISNGVVEVAVLANGSQNSSLGASDNSAANLVVDGGTLSYLGATATTDRAATLGANGGTLGVASGGTALTVSGALTGAGPLTKSGAGTLTLGVANNYAGGTIINSGTLQVNNNAAAGPGGLTNNAATLRIQGALVLDNLVDFEGNCGLEFNGVGGNNTALRGNWVGGGTVNVYFLSANTAQTFTIGGTGHMWDFTGTVDFGTNTGFLRINNENSTVNFGSSNATFNVGTGNGALNQRNGGTTTHLGALLGGPNTKLAGRGNSGASGLTTYSIGGKNLSTVFDGSITNGGTGTTASGTAITKVGTGTLTLTGISSHTGDTIVQEGTLQVDGQFIAGPVANVASAVTVNGGTLSGHGTLEGTVTVNFGGYLSPGASVGRLTVGSLALNSGATNIMEIHKANGTNDAVYALNFVSYGGALVVANLGGTLVDGDTFKLFDAPPGNYFGAFDTIELPTLTGPYLIWDTSRLTVDGTISVYLPKPTVTEFGIDGGNLYITGNNGGNTSTHYIVVTSTSVTAPAASWTPIFTNTFAFDGSFGFTNAINPATPARFFRVKTP